MDTKTEFLKLIIKIRNIKPFEHMQTGLNMSEVLVMRLLYDIPEAIEVNMSDVSKELSITKSAVSQMVNKLERKKLIRRVRNKQDKKVINLLLTDKGKRLFQGESLERTELFDRVVTRMGGEMEQFLQSANHLLDCFRQEMTAEGANGQRTVKKGGKQQACVMQSKEEEATEQML